jgi:hypothetical protein
LDKEYLGSEYLNEKEQALIPLLTELRALSLWAPIAEEMPSFEILKQYIRKHNLPRLIPLLEKYAIKKKGHSVRPLLFSKLSNKFNAAACEGLWRELYQLIASTQEGYADAVDTFSKRKRNRYKREIEECLHTLGYEGSYPTFRKKGAIKGLRTEQSYGQSYFIGREKNVAFLVHCKECMDGDVFNTQFLCGTALLKRKESIEDIYSCTFGKNGRRLFKLFFWNPESAGTPAQFAAIAAKRAECTKLSKDERKMLDCGMSFWGYFFLTCIFAGGLFATLMTAAAFLILSLVTVVTIGFSGIPEMLREMPWVFIFLFCFFGFGVSMAIVDTKARMK